MGLSPPTRGSRAHELPHQVARGSIPAHTGKPPTCCADSAPRTVYPRPHGEASGCAPVSIDGWGLSPPTRGSRKLDVSPRIPQGSIPAHTGKPAGEPLSPTSEAVYPRPHGEAQGDFIETQLGTGLSPPTRGSRCDDRGRARRARSIPAHTGKPRPTSGGAAQAGVYPRPHGEAREAAKDYYAGKGLSPPTRGSLVQRQHRPRDHGSIPAHTGKPWRPGRRCTPPRVYPRPHGEAASVWSFSVVPWGLSPPTRGSRRDSDGHSDAPRSIPAHTGKPPPGAWRPRSCTVYPRPHGEAGKP